MKSLDDLRKAFSGAGVDVAKPIVTSCGSGVSALAVTLALYRLGVRGTGLYDGSWSEWGMPEGPPVRDRPRLIQRLRTVTVGCPNASGWLLRHLCYHPRAMVARFGALCLAAFFHVALVRLRADSRRLDRDGRPAQHGDFRRGRADVLWIRPFRLFGCRCDGFGLRRRDGRDLCFVGNSRAPPAPVPLQLPAMFPRPAQAATNSRASPWRLFQVRQVSKQSRLALPAEHLRLPSAPLAHRCAAVPASVVWGSRFAARTSFPGVRAAPVCWQIPHGPRATAPRHRARRPVSTSTIRSRRTENGSRATWRADSAFAGFLQRPLSHRERGDH